MNAKYFNTLAPIVTVLLNGICFEVLCGMDVYFSLDEICYLPTIFAHTGVILSKTNKIHLKKYLETGLNRSCQKLPMANLASPSFVKFAPNFGQSNIRQEEGKRGR